MSNYLATLTHIGLLSCGQTFQPPLCCYWRTQRDRVCFCENMSSKFCGKKRKQHTDAAAVNYFLIDNTMGLILFRSLNKFQVGRPISQDSKSSLNIWKGISVTKVKMRKTTKKKQLMKKKKEQQSLSKAKLLPHSWHAINTPSSQPPKATLRLI